MFYSFRAYPLYFNYLQQSTTRGQKFSKAAHSFKFRTLLIFSIIQPLKSSLILNAHMFSKEYIIGKFLVRFGVHGTYAEVGCNLKVDHHSQQTDSISHARGRLHHWEVQQS